MYVLLSALELDEVRIERANEYETGLEKQINFLKKKLEFSRQKKTEVMIRHDIEEVSKLSPTIWSVILTDYCWHVNNI